MKMCPRIQQPMTGNHMVIEFLRCQLKHKRQVLLGENGNVNGFQIGNGFLIGYGSRNGRKIIILIIIEEDAKIRMVMVMMTTVQVTEDIDGLTEGNGLIMVNGWILVTGNTLGFRIQP